MTTTEVQLSDAELNCVLYVLGYHVTYARPYDYAKFNIVDPTREYLEVAQSLMKNKDLCEELPETDDKAYWEQPLGEFDDEAKRCMYYALWDYIQDAERNMWDDGPLVVDPPMDKWVDVAKTLLDQYLELKKERDS